MPFVVDARSRLAPASEAAPARGLLWCVRSGLIAAALLLYWWGAGERGLWSSHEGRAAQSSQNILETGDWLLPRLHSGAVETQKPPMYAWLSAASAKVLGAVDGWSIRLPALVASVVGLLLVFEFGRAIGGLPVGLTAATALACTTRYAWLARVGRMDMPLAAAVLGCLFLFWRTRVQSRHAQRQPPLPYAFYGLLAFAVLLKGPIAAVLVGLPIVLWMALAGRPFLPRLQQGGWGEWRELRLPAGGTAALLAAGAWFAYADYRTFGAFGREFFLYHNLGRLLGVDEPLKASPWWTYVPRLAIDFFPWSILLPTVTVGLWKTRRAWRQSPAGPTVLFLLAWIVGPFVLLSAVGFKRMDYLLPIYPAVALLVAWWLDDRRRRFHAQRQVTVARDYLGRSRWILARACLLAAIAAPLIYWGERQFARKGGLAKTLLNAALLDRHFNETDEFMLLRAESILREHWPLLGILLPGLVAAVWLLHTGWHERLNGRLATGLAVPWAICYLVQVQVVMPRLDGLRAMERFAQTVRHLAGDGRTIYYFDEFDADLVFHAGKPAKLVRTWDDLGELARTPTPVFVVLRTDQWKRKSADPGAAGWREVANNCHFAKHRQPRSFLTNRPEEVADRLRTIPEVLLR